MALTLSVAENLMLEAASLPQFRHGPFLNRRALRRFAARHGAGVRHPGRQHGRARRVPLRRQPAKDRHRPCACGASPRFWSPSARRAAWMSPRPPMSILVCANDRREGGAILLISTELDEVIGPEQPHRRPVRRLSSSASFPPDTHPRDPRPDDGRNGPPIIGGVEGVPCVTGSSASPASPPRCLTTLRADRRRDPAWHTTIPRDALSALVVWARGGRATTPGTR